jgi:drug/metabolite transporter (DMT)-like permease
MKNGIGTLQVLAAGACFGFLGVFGKLAFASGLTVGELLSFRFLLAWAVLALFLLFFRRSWIFIGRRQVLVSLLLGVFGYAVFSTLYFESIKGITVGLAALLLFTFPLFVNLGSWIFLKEPLHPRQILSLVLSTTGLVLLVWGDWAIQQFAAVGCGLGAAITYAGYVLVSGQVQKNVRPLSSSFYVITGAGLTLLAFHQPSLTKLTQLSSSQGLYVLGISLICTIAPLTLFLAGLQKMSSSKASILVMIEPVVATLAGVLIFGESMTALQMIGAGLILSAMFFQSHDPGPSESLS